MTGLKIIGERIRGLEFDLERLKLERESILNMPDTNINNFASPNKRSALRRVNGKINAHDKAILFNYEIMKKVFNT